MRFSAYSVALLVASSLLGPGAGSAETTQRYGRSVRSTRSYARNPTRSHGGYRSVGVNRSHRGTFGGHRRYSYGGYRSFYRPHTRYGPYYGYRPYYRPYAYYRPSFYSSWGWPGWGYRPWPTVGVSVSYSPRIQYYSGGPTDYSNQNGAVRTEVNPKQTEVWLDGYYSGTVDDFDGSFQRLYIPPGEHEILLRLDGYRTYREVIRVSPERTYKLHHEMEPLGPGESAPPPPEPASPTPRQEPRQSSPSSWSERSERSEQSEPSMPSATPSARMEQQKPREPKPRTAPSRFGRLSLRVQPTESQVYIDGELWGSLEGFEELAIHLPVGPHRIEIRGWGMESFETEVEIRTGETTPLHVKLDGRSRL